MTASNFDKIYDHVILKLNGLAPELTYHSIDHTLDVLRHSVRIAKDEGINEKELYLLKVAALYHDTGFLQTYANHEMKSCGIFLEDSALFNFSDPDKSLVHDLIMVTKMPQKPHTLLQKIICDADLDYLGRNDFKEIAQRLKIEFLHYGVVADETAWKKLQIKFFEDHHYHTRSSLLQREPVKMNNFENLH